MLRFVELDLVRLIKIPGEWRLKQAGVRGREGGRERGRRRREEGRKEKGDKDKWRIRKQLSQEAG